MNRIMKKNLKWYGVASLVVLLFLTILIIGCQSAAGPAGPTGPAGPAGSSGSAGSSGPSGPAGPTGPAAPTEEAPKPVIPVEVSAGDDQTVEPGSSVNLKASVTVNDGSSITSYEWTQTSGLGASLGNAATDTLEVTLDSAAAYKDGLMQALETLDRFTVQAINPHSLEAAEIAEFKLTVTTSSGSYSDMVNVTAHLPYVWNTGLSNVPVDVTVLLHGKNQDAYKWSLAGPSDSAAALDDASNQNPVFTPDVVGKYELTESNSGAAFNVYAGTWAGSISGQDANGRPLSAGCTSCHNDMIASDQFTAWKASGHAEIFTDNLNTSTHYGENCFTCHTVGFDKGADNGGIDEAADYTAFLDAGMINKPSPDNWSNVLAKFPKTAKLANIQCESCHGPNNSPLHMNDTIDAERVSVSSDVCGACHGEPLRHGRFQQWEESGHSNYELAISRGTNPSCASCHSGQGFIAWQPQIEAGDASGSLAADDVTWTADTVHPITCAACHDPHDQGTTSGEPNTATVRVEGDTPLLQAGFKAAGVGRGALCMTCHNSRRGERNDTAYPIVDDQAPHAGPQADVLMGQNAYFVTVGNRSSHSYIENTCTKCHMELSPPPAELSYNLGGTNHTFEASMDICTSCHGDFDGGSLQEATHANLEELKEAIGVAILAEIKAQKELGRTLILVGAGSGGADVNISNVNNISHIELLEYHGRSAMNITIGGTTYENILLASGTAINYFGVSTGDTLVSSESGQNIAKAAWNYFLIHSDGSEGVHNPSFTVETLNAAIKALK